MKRVNRRRRLMMIGASLPAVPTIMFVYFNSINVGIGFVLSVAAGAVGGLIGSIVDDYLSPGGGIRQ